VLNDAEVQGFGLIEGNGLELVRTLGTGVGTALFRDGDLMPHLELAQHLIRKGESYDEYIGNAALHRKGAKKSSRRVHKAIASVRSLVHYDVLHIRRRQCAEAHRPTAGCAHWRQHGGSHRWPAALADPASGGAVLAQAGSSKPRVAIVRAQGRACSARQPKRQMRASQPGQQRRPSRYPMSVAISPFPNLAGI
jgi:hypothetical protein